MAETITEQPYVPVNRLDEIGKMLDKTITQIPISIPYKMKESEVRSLIEKYFLGITLEIKKDLAGHDRYFIVGRFIDLQDLENLLKINLYRYPQTGTSYVDYCSTCDEKVNETNNCLGCPVA